MREKERSLGEQTTLIFAQVAADLSRLFVSAGILSVDWTIAWRVIITFLFALLLSFIYNPTTKRIWIACLTVRALEQENFRELSQQGLETLKLSG